MTVTVTVGDSGRDVAALSNCWHGQAAEGALEVDGHGGRLATVRAQLLPADSRHMAEA